MSEKYLYVNWEMSIGYPTAIRKGRVGIPLSELEGKTEEEREEIISESIWEDAVQNVDVYPTGESEG